MILVLVIKYRFTNRFLSIRYTPSPSDSFLTKTRPLKFVLAPDDITSLDLKQKEFRYLGLAVLYYIIQFSGTAVTSGIYFKPELNQLERYPTETPARFRFFYLGKDLGGMLAGMNHW